MSGVGATGYRYQFQLGDQHHKQEETPYFQRMDQVNEVSECRALIEKLQHRVNNLEKINVDLEHRLEEQAKLCMEVEKECVNVERTWRAKAEGLEKEIEEWKKKNDAQNQKTERLREALSRTEKELYGILQRKYELMRGPGGGRGPSSTNMNMHTNNPLTRDGHASTDNLRRKNDNSGIFDEPFGAQAIKAPQEIRQKRMMASLKDFLGI